MFLCYYVITFLSLASNCMINSLVYCKYWWLLFICWPHAKMFTYLSWLKHRKFNVKNLSKICLNLYLYCEWHYHYTFEDAYVLVKCFNYMDFLFWHKHMCCWHVVVPCMKSPSRQMTSQNFSVRYMIPVIIKLFIC